VPFFLQNLIVLSLLPFNYFLTLDLHVDELSLILVDIIPLPALSVIIIFFVTNAAVIELLFLEDHYSFYAMRALLELELTFSNFFGMVLFHLAVLFGNLFYFFHFLLLAEELLM